MSKTQKETEGTPRLEVNLDQNEVEEIVLIAEDMELRELDLEGIEKACDNPKTGYIPISELVLLKEALIRTKGARGLGVVLESMKGGEGKHRGRRSNSQRIKDVGGKLVASKQYPKIEEAFNLLTKTTQ